MKEEVWKTKKEPFEIIKAERSKDLDKEKTWLKETQQKAYISSEEIKNRLEQSREITKWNICKVKFEFQHMLERHYVKIHNAVPIYLWNLWNCPFFVLASFRDHIKFHKFTSSKIKIKTKKKKRKIEKDENEPPNREDLRGKSESLSQARSSKSLSPPKILRTDTLSQLEEKGIKVDLRKKEFKHLKKRKPGRPKKVDSDNESIHKKRDLKAEDKEESEEEQKEEINESHSDKQEDHAETPEQTEAHEEPKKKRRRRKKKHAEEPIPDHPDSNEIKEEKIESPQIHLEEPEDIQKEEEPEIKKHKKKKEKDHDSEDHHEKHEKRKRSKSDKKRLKEIASMDIVNLKKEAKLILERMKELIDDNKNESSMDPTADTTTGKISAKKELESQMEQIESFNEFAGPSHWLDGTYWQLLSLI